MVLEANSSYKQRIEICKRCRGNQEASLCETGFDHIDFSELMSIELFIPWFRDWLIHVKTLRHQN